jgi:S-adenosylmethionine-diacylgycerolhomoserine-N-methlytransferase
MAQSSTLDDLRTLWHLCLHRTRGESHQERLDSFYAGQAEGYDRFRQRLLHGRQEMIDLVEPPEGGVWVDLGAGTGENAERIGDRLSRLQKLYLVDLCPSLLKVARERIAKSGWTNVVPVEADATTFVPAEGSADVVTFSYSLTMIPDWFRVVDQAVRWLKPGGTLAVVDFYVSRKHPADVMRRHGWWTRTFWPAWFASSNVWLNPDHLPYLRSRVATQTLIESAGRVPYLPLARAPYYIFVGRKAEAGASSPVE